MEKQAERKRKKLRRSEVADKATSGRIEAKTTYTVLKVSNARGKVPSLKVDKGTWAKLRLPETTAEQTVRDSKPALETSTPPKGPIRNEVESGNNTQGPLGTPAALKFSQATADAPCGSCTLVKRESEPAKCASSREHTIVVDPNHAVVLAWVRGIDKKRKATDPKGLGSLTSEKRHQKATSSAEQRSIKRWQAVASGGRRRH